MKRIRLSINIIWVSIFCLYAALAACFTTCKQGNQRISLDESSGLDTIIKTTWEFGYFQLYYNHVVEGGNYPVNAFASIQLSKGRYYYLFDCNPYMDGNTITSRRLYGDLFSFPYASGGNYSRNSGIEVFRVTTDTVVYIGKVCGYGDIDRNGKKEFWVYLVSEYGEGNAFNKLEKVPVKLSGDSLIYPFLDGGY